MVGVLRTVRRALLWALGGATLGGTVAAFAHLGGSALTGCLMAGAAAGGLLLAWMPPALEHRGGKLVALLYSGYFVGAAFVAGDLPVLAAICGLMVGAVLARWWVVPARPSSRATEALRVAAVIVWVLTILGIFAFLIGLYLLPLAIALSIAARGSGTFDGAARTSVLDSLSVSGASVLAGVAVGAFVAAAGAGGGGGWLAGLLVFAVTWWYARRWPAQRRALKQTATP